ncbi:MAG: 23S rRNA (pseudouridine(1915)-N(3))-methyltransferase RlmH [Clostridia bacterium]|jgi:23S rRNA (pseudouridine1915-N3)-methyltransferase|nr:23S rRNA (pseudouridine(1915)-N(3))-methyltransferase RlmH [Clostridia bacterium]
MKIRICCVGKLKEAFFTDACAEFQKRLSRFCELEIVEVPDEKAPESLHPADEAIVKEKEGRRILKAIGPKDFVVALAIDGSQMTSEAFAAYLAERETEARPLTFVIGGSLGLSDEVYARANARLSFSKMTFPHRIARLLLLEQLYRGFKIRAHEAYHK